MMSMMTAPVHDLRLLLGAAGGCSALDLSVATALERLEQRFAHGKYRLSGDEVRALENAAIVLGWQ